jgi:hypothetical protein
MIREKFMVTDEIAKARKSRAYVTTHAIIQATK